MISTPRTPFADPYHLVEESIKSKTFSRHGGANPILHIRYCKIQRAGDDYIVADDASISRAAPEKPIIAQGLTHMRLNENGKIVFHQDYWDTSALLDQLPVVGFWTRLVKNRILESTPHD